MNGFDGAPLMPDFREVCVCVCVSSCQLAQCYFSSSSHLVCLHIASLCSLNQLSVPPPLNTVYLEPVAVQGDHPHRGKLVLWALPFSTLASTDTVWQTKQTFISFSMSPCAPWSQDLHGTSRCRLRDYDIYELPRQCQI